MEIPPFVDVFPIGKKGGFPWLMLVYRRLLYDYYIIITLYVSSIPLHPFGTRCFGGLFEPSKTRSLVFSQNSPSPHFGDS